MLYQSFVGSYSCGALAPLCASAFVYGITEPHLVLCMMSYMCVCTSWVCLACLVILFVRAYAHNTKTVGML